MVTGDDNDGIDLLTEILSADPLQFCEINGEKKDL